MPVLAWAEAALRTARRAHPCSGWHDGERRRRCPLGPILSGEVYVENFSEAAAYQSGTRYHVACAYTQGVLVRQQMPARDALADAETLRLEWRSMENDLAPAHLWVGYGDWIRGEDHVTAHLWQSGLLGSFVVHECVESAREAARCAFLAVPGLRGDA